MTQTEALNLALDALEHCKDVIEERGLNGNPEFAKMWGLTLSIDRANQAITAIKEALANHLKPRCFADFQPNHEHDRKCQWCAVETECKTGMAQLEQEPVGYVQTVIEALYENGDPISVDAAELLQRISAQPEQKPVAQSRPFTKKQRDTLCTVYAIASASTTANSLPNIAKIVNQLLTEDLEVQPKEPEQEPVAWAMLHDNGDFIDAINPEEHARIEGDYKHALYTTPPQRTWVGLTNEDIRQLEKENTVGGYHGDYCPTWDLIEATEAKLKEKNK